MLVAIAIPVFTTQLEKSREATDLANIRSAYADSVTQYLSNGTGSTVEVDLKQTQSGWNYVTAEIGTTISAAGSGSGSGGKIEFTGTPNKGGKATITINDANGDVTITCS